jgi:hypothetical protein
VQIVGGSHARYFKIFIHSVDAEVRTGESAPKQPSRRQQMLGGEYARPRYVPHAALRRLHAAVAALGALWLATSFGLLYSWRRHLGTEAGRSLHEVKELTSEVLILRQQLASMAMASSGHARVGGGAAAEDGGEVSGAAAHLAEAEHIARRLRSQLLPESEPAPDHAAAREARRAAALASLPAGARSAFGEAASASESRVDDALRARRRAAGQHPDFRVAMLVPWLGPSFPPWFPLFVASCGGSDYLFDWLLFYEDASVDVPTNRIPPNVHFHSVGAHGMGAIFGVELARLTDAENQTHSHVRLLQHAFSTWPYAITEYKPTYGDVFAGATATGPWGRGVVRAGSCSIRQCQPTSGDAFAGGHGTAPQAGIGESAARAINRGSGVLRGVGLLLTFVSLRGEGRVISLKAAAGPCLRRVVSLRQSLHNPRPYFLPLSSVQVGLLALT